MLVQCSSCRKLFSANDDYCSCGASVTTSMAYSGPETAPTKQAPAAQPVYNQPPAQPAYSQPPAAPQPAYSQPPAVSQPAYSQPPAAPQPVYSQPPAAPQPAYSQPPAAPQPISRPPQSMPATGEEAIFFAQSTTKVAIMYIFTCGLYGLVWSYRNWRYLRERRNLACIPGVRTWFNVIWFLPLMKEIKKVGLEVTPQAGFSETANGISYILCMLLSGIPGFLLLSILPFVGANNYICRMNRDTGREHLIGTQFTIWCWLSMAIFPACLVIALVIGSLSKSGS